jgi:hypothetical protein
MSRRISKWFDFRSSMKYNDVGASETN